MAGAIDFQLYLDSVYRHYAEWWKLDPLTGMSEGQQPLFDFEQRVQLVIPREHQAMKQHPSFAREGKIELENAWYEYVGFHPDDRACELTLTMLAFHILN